MSSAKTVSIFLAEDQLIARMGLRMLLEQNSRFSVLGEAEDGESAVSQVLQLKPDIVMMDLGLPKLDGIQATSQIKKALPETKVLIFTTAEDDSSIFAALKAGADGYCLKTISAEMLAIAIQSVLSGAAWLDPGIAHKVLRAQQQGASQASQASAGAAKLSDSKMQLLSLVEKGKSFEEIALELKINDTLVKGLLDELLAQLKGETPSKSSHTGSRTQKSASVSIRPGDIVGQHYKIIELIGEGGMGAVYKAEHTFIDRTVAIKTLHEHLANEPSTLARFKVEAESNARVSHQHLVTSYDFGLIEGKIPYMVMEYLEGESLEDMLYREGRLEEKFARTIFAQVCDALDAVHAKGIIHRDLKPGNVMLLRKDGSYHVKVVDFGIAKILDSGKVNVTRTGECLGSPLYMSPEQCWGSGKYQIDHRSDLYALGCMMYETFSGLPIFDAESVLEVVMKHIKEPPSLKPLQDAGVSDHVIDLISKLTRKSQGDRPGSAADVRECLLRN